MILTPLEVLQHIFEEVSEGIRDQIIQQHVLKNLYGFEYLIAPYTIAHLKLSQFLHDKGYTLRQKERLQIYLTNTLEPIQPQINLLLPALSREIEAAQEIKEKPILVITGNPPYSGHSKNPSFRIETVTAKDGKKKRKVKVPTFIGELIEDYKKVDGKPLGEKNPKWLQDDYVKFIRFAQWKMQDVPEGIVGIITNHSFMDNPTFRGMRQSLMQTFNQIYVLNLHGNLKKLTFPLCCFDHISCWLPKDTP
jgi:predicted helicase